MKDDFSFQNPPAYVKQTSGKPPLFVILIGVLVLIVLILIALFFIGEQKKQSSSGVSPLPTHSAESKQAKPSVSPKAEASVSAKPSAVTPSPSLDRAKLRVTILNGSGTAGAAKEISSHLNGLGYTIVATGNADEFTYRNITVKIKKAKNEYLALLKKDIAENAPSVTILASVDEDIKTDAEVIVGK